MSEVARKRVQGKHRIEAIEGHTGQIRSSRARGRAQCRQKARAGPRRRKCEPEVTRLERTTFEISRMLEFFTEKELGMQIGHSQGEWPLALLKELLDNALDACESAGVAPEITVTIERNALRVRDNGPGLPPAVLERSLDYSVRVSDKAHYVSPTRGQLGNALKCLYASAYVHSPQQVGTCEILTGGVRHVVTVKLDQIEQVPKINLVHKPGFVKTGTEIVWRWRDLPWYLGKREKGTFYKRCSAYGPDGKDFYWMSTPEDDTAWGLVRRFSLFNPHATFHYRDGAADTTFSPVAAPTWEKWRPDHPTSAHWYTPEQFKALLAAYITADRQTGRGRTVREVVAEFAGLSGTAKQKRITRQLGLTSARIEDLIDGEDLDLSRVTELLAAMQAETRPIPAKALGTIGRERLTTHLQAHWGVDAKQAVLYDRGTSNGTEAVPHVIESTTAMRGDDDRRLLVVGLNFSPVLDSTTIEAVVHDLGEEEIDYSDPVLVVVHLTCPQLRFADHGKSRLLLGEDESGDHDD